MLFIELKVFLWSKSKKSWNFFIAQLFRSNKNYNILGETECVSKGIAFLSLYIALEITCITSWREI